MRDCFKCDISIKRLNIVNGVGKVPSEIMFIGEAPGYYEDKYGIPFIGKSGQILTTLLDLAGFKRENIFITNMIRCRPPGNREPTVTEILNCKKFLSIELQIVKPKIIVSLGSVPTKVLLNSLDIQMGKVVGIAVKTKSYIIFPLYHPSYLLRGTPKVKEGKFNTAITHMINLVELYRGVVNPLHQSNF
jgi:uracil-DNA glycosylase